MKILVTGFEPFGGAQTNPSWEAVSLLPDTIGGAELERMQLPVVYGEAGQRVLRRAAEMRPALVVCTGAAGGRKAVTPELVAVNWRMASIADNAGNAFHGEPIDPAAPAAYRTPLPVMTLVDAAREAGVPCQLSLSAGGYVCNDVYWHLLTGQEAGGYQGLFVHVPLAEDLPPQKTAEGLCAILVAAIRALSDGGAC